MKASEATILSLEELVTLRDLFQRWMLVTFPFNDGSSENCDAGQTYMDVQRDVEAGGMSDPRVDDPEWYAEWTNPLDESEARP